MSNLCYDSIKGMNINSNFLKLFLFFIFSSILIISLSSVSAGEVRINSTDSINDIVSEINTNGSGDYVITLDPGTYNKANDINNTINVNDSNITIQGNGKAGDVIIDAIAGGFLFRFIGNNTNVSFKNITLTNANNGGINFTSGNSTLKIEDSIFSNNSINRRGGAIAISASTNVFYVYNSNFTNNSALVNQGGAIVSYSPFTINNSIFINNKASGGGGAIASIGGNTIYSNITNSKFIGNIANCLNEDASNVYGGAIYLVGNNSNISNNIFIANDIYINVTYSHPTITQWGSAFAFTGYNCIAKNNVLIDSYYSDEINKTLTIIHFKNDGTSENNTYQNSSNSSITVNNSSPNIGKGINVSGVLKDVWADVTLAGITLNVSVGGVDYTAITEEDGSYSVIVTAPLISGEYNITVNWVGNSDYTAFVNFTSITVLSPVYTNSSIVVNNSSPVFGDSVNISGYLANYTNIDAVNVSVDGVSELVDVNDTTGFWSLNYLSTHAGAIDVIVSLSGNSFYEDFTNSTTFNVIKADTNSTIIIEPLTGFVGDSFVISGYLANYTNVDVVNVSVDGFSYLVDVNDTTGFWSLNYLSTRAGLINVVVSLSGNPFYEDFANSTDLTLVSPDSEPPTVLGTNGGTYFGNVLVNLNISEEGSIYYTLDGSTPTNESTLYTGPFTLSKSVTLKYIAIDLVGNPSKVYIAKYDINKATTPKIPSVKEGSYKNDVKVSLTGGTGNKIYYKLGNSAYKLYTGPLTIKASTTLSYYYQDPNGAKSLIKSVKYLIDKTAPRSLENNIKKYKAVKAKKQTLKIKFSENIKINSKNLKKILVKNSKGKKIKVQLSVKGNYLLVKVPKIAKKTKYIINIPKNIVSDNIGNVLRSKVVLRYLSK